MIKLFIATFLLFSTSSFTAEIDWANFSFENDCADGKCVDEIISNLELEKAQAFKEGCIPGEHATQEEADVFYMHNVIDESCIARIRKIQEFNEHLKIVQAEYEAKRHGAVALCNVDGSKGDAVLNGNLADLAQVGASQENQCTEEKKKIASDTCMDDVMCGVAASLTGPVGQVLSLMGADEKINESLPGDCDINDDNCLARLASGFIKASWHFLKGTWDLLKMGAGYVKNKVVDSWNSLWGVEDKSSDSALAMAKMSEDEGVWATFKKDPLGSMSKGFSALVGMLKEWMKNDVYCQKWSGQPHFSECVEPYSEFDCLSCKTIINGTCNAAGVVLAEVVPAFLTGGLVSGIKYGASAAGKLAKMVKLSDKARKALKVTGLDKVARGSGVILRGTGELLSVSARKIGTFFKTGWNKNLAGSFSKLNDLARKGGVHYIVGKGWSGVKFGGRGLKNIGKVIIYPIENPLTRKAFDLGLNSFQRLSAKATGSIYGGVRLSLASDNVVAVMDDVDKAFLKLQKMEKQVTSDFTLAAKGSKKVTVESRMANTRAYSDLRADYLNKVKSNREAIFQEVLKNKKGNVKLSEVVDDLYPELNYSSELSKTISTSQIKNAESELKAFIGKIEDPKLRDKLLVDFNTVRSSPSRVQRGVDNRRYFAKEEVLKNAKLSTKARHEHALRLTGIDSAGISTRELNKLLKGVDDAHAIGSLRGASVYEYSNAEILAKYKTLKNAGFDNQQVHNLIRSGIAGDPPGQLFSDGLVKLMAKNGNNAGLKNIPDYEAFMKVNRAEVNRLLKAGDIGFLDAAPAKFQLIKSSKTGKEYYLLKSGNNPKTWRVFNKDGKKFGFFGKRSEYFDNLKVSGGETFRTADGADIRLFNINGKRRIDIGGRLNKEYIRAVTKNAKKNGVANLDEFNSFATKYERELNGMLDGRKFNLTEMSPKNFDIVTSPKTKDTFYLLKTGESEADWLLFSTNKKKIRGGNANATTLAEFKAKSNDVLRFSDGSGLRILPEAKPYEKFAKIREVASNDFKAKKYFDDLKVAGNEISDSKTKAAYSKFLKEKQKEFGPLVAKGDFSPSRFKPENFNLATDIDTGKQYFAFKGAMYRDDLLIPVKRNKYNVFEDSYTKLDGVLKNDGQVLHFSDGTGMKVTSSVDGIVSFGQIDEIVTKSWLKENDFWAKTLSEGKKTLDSAESVAHETFINSNKAELTNLLMKDKIKLTELDAGHFRTAISGNGESVIVLKTTNDPGDWLVFTKEAGNKKFSRFADVSKKIGNEVRFSDETSMRVWKSGQGTAYESVDLVANRANVVVDNLVKKFAVRNNAGELINDEYIKFLQANRHSVKDLLKARTISSDNLVPDFFGKIKSKVDGDEYFFIKPKNNLEQPLLFRVDGKPFPNGKSFVEFKDFPTKNGNEFKVLTELSSKRKMVVVTEDGVNKLSDIRSPNSIKPKYTQESVLDNSILPFKEKFSEGLIITGKAAEPLSASDIAKLENALQQALNVGKSRGAGAFGYTPREMKKMSLYLKGGGFTQKETEVLLRSGVAARPPTRYLGKLAGDFKDEFVSISSMPFHKKKEYLAKLLSKNGNAEKVGVDAFKQARLTPAEVQQTIDNIDGLYFVDYAHSSDELFNLANGKSSFAKTDIGARYKEYGVSPFENYKNTQKWLMSEQPDMNMDTMKKIHTQMMDGGVERLSKDQLGIIRDGEWYGNVPNGSGLSDEVVKEMADNAYITFVKTGTDAKGSTGKIMYPNSSYVKQEALDRIRPFAKTTVERIEELKNVSLKTDPIREQISKLGFGKQALIDDLAAAKAKHKALEGLGIKNPAQVDEFLGLKDKILHLGKSIDNYESTVFTQRVNLNAKITEIENAVKLKAGEKTTLTKHMTEAMVAERLDWFNKSRKAIGQLDSPQKLEEYTDLLARFQRDLVSIHPLPNGNGRSTRMFALYYPLMREGFPPPRIMNPNDDLYKPLKAWQKEIRDGIVASNRMMDDLVERAEVGLKLENSPELLAPVRKGEIRLNMVQDSKKTPLVDAPNMETINNNQYNEYVRKVIKDDPSLAARVKTDPNGAWDEINELALAEYKKNNVYYDYKRYKGKERVERLQLGIVGDDFKQMYGRATYNDPKAYQYKMDEWYKDEINWRGLAARSEAQVKSEEEIVGMFKQMSPHMTSNHVLGARTADPEAIRKVAMGDIDTYMKSLNQTTEGRLEDIAKWHSEAINPHYGRSIGYSTSADEKVGKAFAMGAMVVADYGQHQKFQHLLSQRILVGARRSVKDVDFMRLKKLRGDFSYKYYRQKEVMGVGAADPDSIMIIKNIDDKGKAINTYLRDPDNPHIVFLVKGEAEVGKVPLKSDILKVIDLRGGGGI